MIERLRVRIPAEATGQFFFFRVHLSNLIFGREKKKRSNVYSRELQCLIQAVGKGSLSLSRRKTSSETLVNHSVTAIDKHVSFEGKEFLDLKLKFHTDSGIGRLANIYLR